MSNSDDTITIGSDITTPVSVDNGPHTVTIGDGDTNVSIGNGQDTITAGNNDTIVIGNGNDTNTFGNNDNVTIGNGNHTTMAGTGDSITTGDGQGTIVAGADSTIKVGNGNNQITAGPDSTIVAGNGPDTLHVGHDTSITLGSGPDTVHAGTTDTITFLKGGPDTIDYDGLTPRFNTPASITVSEEHSIALPITLFPRNLGNEVINGFKPQNGVIAFDTRDFANTAAVFANAAQVGANVVITQPQGSGSLTLANTSLPSLSSSNFAFFTGPDEVITISGLPADATLSAGTNDGGGTWSLTPEQLPGLIFNAGEPSGYPTRDNVTVTMTNPAGQGATLSENFPLQVTAILPTLSETPLIYQTGIPLVETSRLAVASATDDGDTGNDYINRLQFNNVPIGVTLSSPAGTVVNNGGGQWTLSTSGNPASFNPEIDISTPQTTEFNLGITTFSDEPHSPELSVSTSQNVDVIYAGAGSTLNFDPGDDTAHSGTSDTVNLAAGTQTVAFDTLTPSFTVPSSTVNVNEGQSVAIPITFLPPSLGNEVINGFTPATGVIGFDTQDFANSAAVFSNAAQVGSNVVITQPGGGGSVTLNGVNLSSLSASNFAFFAGSDVVTISGVPTDATLSAGVNNGGGNWTLTPAQLSGLTLNAGEPTGYPTADTLTVTVANNTSGHTASSSESFPLVVHAIPPTVSDTVLPYQSGDPVTETRLQVNSAVDNPSNNDTINRIVFTGVSSGTTITSPDANVSGSGSTYTLTPMGSAGPSFNPEVDVTTPTLTGTTPQATNFNLGISAYSDENGQEVSSSTSQNIDVQYNPVAQGVDFTTSGQSIWGPSGFSTSNSQFYGLNVGPYSFGVTIIGTGVGGSLGLKAGFQSDLNVNSGTFSASLPYNIALANTYNVTNDTMEIDPSDTEGKGSFSTTGAEGGFSLAFILDGMARVYAGPVSLGISENTTIPILGGGWNLGASQSGTGTISTSKTSSFSTDIHPIDIGTGFSLNFGIGSVSGGLTLLNTTVAPGISLKQAFSLYNSALSAVLQSSSGKTAPIMFGTPTVLTDASSYGSFDLGLTPQASLSNDTSLSEQLVLGLQALAAHLSASILSIGVSGAIGPLITLKTTLGLGSSSLYDQKFPVAFGSQSVNFTVT